MAGPLFQDSQLPVTVWCRAMWQVPRQKHGSSAVGLPRVLGLGRSKTAWALRHQLRRAMGRPGRDRRRGVVEVDETDWGGEAAGGRGRPTDAKALIAVAAEADGAGIGRIRLRRIPDTSRRTWHGGIAHAIEPGRPVMPDGLQASRDLQGSRHDRSGQQRQPAEAEPLLPRVPRVASWLTRWRLGPHQGAIAHAHLDDDLDAFTFRFNRRPSASRGKRFSRVAQQAVQVEPAPFESLIHPTR